ncbi:GNAT family N-acetyltransferase [Reyranella sp.]|uniref:GNAT family N-acetyltransferase n=1 Tax=Reyranella sp. TaxID=1929291 RepID=UPI0025D56213|nr:GNAT family N-acetyltransferase [Reyranella sp.]
MTTPVEIAAPRNDADLEAIKMLFREYAESLGFSLAYQDFEKELADFPGKYAAPEGALLLATAGGEAAGTVALRRLDAGVCEMKRLYVKPAFRGWRTIDGRSIGRALAEDIVAIGRERGYQRLRLDTITGKMRQALTLYRSMGFVEIPPYYASPIPDTAYLELVL